MPKLKLVGFPLSDTDYEYFISTCLLVICVFLNLMREKVTQIQETQRVPIQRNPTSLTSRHIIIKMAKFQDKERILKAAREKQEVTHKGALIRLAADFSMETLQVRREWQKIFK